MSKKKTDITLNVTAHKEGCLIYPTLKAIDSMLAQLYSRYNDVCVQVNIGLDSADEITKQYVHKYAQKSSFPVTVFENAFHDPSKNRNFLISKSDGEYILFHDGDDLFSGDYLVTAYAQARSMGFPCIITPGFVIPFDETKIHYIQKYYGTESPQFCKSSFFSTNSFTSQNLVHRKIYEEVRYAENTKPYGYEDWHWNTEVIARGYNFYPAEKTLFFYRYKTMHESVRIAAGMSNAVINSSRLFDPEIYRGLSHVPYACYAPLQNSYAITEVITEIIEEPPADPSRLPLTTKLVASIRDSAQKHMPINGRFYGFYAHQYRSIQQLLSPIIGRLRSINNVNQFLHHQSEAFHRLFSPVHIIVNHTPIMQPLHYSTSKSLNRNRLEALGFGETQIKSWKDLNEIENSILISQDSLYNMVVLNNINLTPLDDLYYNFCAEYYDKGITDIILTPHLVIGGADNAMIYLANQLSKIGRKPMLITTISGNKSPASPRIKQIHGAAFFDLGNENLNIDDEAKILFLVRILQNWDIKSFSVMNSMTGYDLLARYGMLVSSYTKPYIFVFSKGHNELGMKHEYFPLRRAGQYVQRIITDSHFFSNYIASYYGWSTDKVTTISLPYDPVNIHVKKSGIQKRVLFMSRLAREKQIHVMLQVAKRLLPHGISFDIYGIKDDSYCNEILFDEKVKELENVTFRGSVSSYEDIDPDQYDIFLMTSSYEGIPLTLLDSIKANLFIVSSRVGGIGEEIVQGQNGLLVNDSSNVPGYAKAILQYYKDKSLHNLEKRAKANSSSLVRHSYPSFAERITLLYQ